MCWIHYMFNHRICYHMLNNRRTFNFHWIINRYINEYRVRYFIGGINHNFIYLDLTNRNFYINRDFFECLMYKLYWVRYLLISLNRNWYFLRHSTMSCHWDSLFYCNQLRNFNWNFNWNFDKLRNRICTIFFYFMSNWYHHFADD